MAFQACPGDTCAHGEAPDGTPGQILLDGVEYDSAFDALLFSFYAAGSSALSGGGCLVITDTDLTLHPLDADLRQDTNGPVTTKAKYDVWNQNEVRVSGSDRCITCWDQTLLSNYGDQTVNHFLPDVLHTDVGKARIEGLASTQCPFSVDAAILGVASKLMTFQCAPPLGNGFAEAGRSLVGQGSQSATILWDIIAGPQQADDGVGTFEGRRTLKNSGRSGR
jgi:hypothetical protein